MMISYLDTFRSSCEWILLIMISDLETFRSYFSQLESLFYFGSSHEFRWLLHHQSVTYQSDGETFSDEVIFVLEDS